MIVAELIEKLKKMPQDRNVYVEGHCHYRAVSAKGVTLAYAEKYREFIGEYEKERTVYAKIEIVVIENF